MSIMNGGRDILLGNNQKEEKHQHVLTIYKAKILTSKKPYKLRKITSR